MKSGWRRPRRGSEGAVLSWGPAAGRVASPTLPGVGVVAGSLGLGGVWPPLLYRLTLSVLWALPGED